MITEFLGQEMGYVLPQIALLLIGFFVEKHYVSRVTVFTNSTAIAVHVISQPNPGPLIGLYADLGLFLGLWGFAHYVAESSNGGVFRILSFFIYSSTNAAILILTGSLAWAVILGGFLQLVFAVLLGGDLLSYFGPHTMDVKHFIENNGIPLYNPEVGQNQRVGLTDYFDT